MGSKPQVISPTPPQPVSAGQSAAEFAAALPTILESQLEFQPQFDKAALESFRETAPEFAAISQGVLEQFSPNQVQLTEDLAGQFLEGSQQGLPDELKEEFLNTFKANVADPSSPIGASAVAKNLLMEDLAFRQFNQSAGLSFLGRTPVTTAFQNPSSFQVGNSFQPAFNTAQSGQGAFIAGSRPIVANGGQSFAQGAGSILGGIGGGLMGIGGIKTAFG